MLEKHSPLICAYLVFNPNYSVQSLEIIKEYISFNGVKGVKIHPSWHACYPYDEKYREFWEFANKNRLTVLTHSWNPDAPNRAQKFSDAFFFDSIAKQYPGINLILAHAGGRGSYLYRVMEIVGSNSNVYVDFSGDIFEPGLIKAYVQGLGSSEKLLFGSDMPWIDIRFSISSILNADISVEDKRNIFGLNAMKLFGF
jgi:predicted TIM-barrel fold metal-dependent hydrolase